MSDFTTHNVLETGAWADAIDHCVMSYDDRFLRRKVIETASGAKLLVNLAKTTSLDHGAAFQLTDGRAIEIRAASEPLYSVTGDLVQLAWHIGNRHTPCQIESNRLVIQRDPVIGHMLEHLGATLLEIDEPFTPEGGAYGHGRTHSHEHGATAHEH